MARHVDPKAANEFERLANTVMEAVAAGKLTNTLEFAHELRVDHQTLLAPVNSLISEGYLNATVEERVEWKLSDEGKRYVKDGTPEGQVFEVLKKGPVNQADLMKALPDVAKVGLGQLMKQKVAKSESTGTKENKVVTLSLAEGKEGWVDSVHAILVNFDGNNLPPKTLQDLKSRKMVEPETLKPFVLSKGAAFPSNLADKPWLEKKLADVTEHDIMKAIKSDKLPSALKLPNLEADGVKERGALHPLLKLRQEYREIFLEMGFQEMRTDRFVDSSFWNFDTLFVPQKHPARDAQDTFFISDPERCTQHPKEYLEATKKVHSTGDYGSTGYQYDWTEDETQKNVLRTHTTACSAYTLYEIGQEYKKTGKLRTGAYFSIDRVFRNEKMDKTHLCEFHQVEGFVLDYNLSLGNMMALLRRFFEKVGMTQLKFKPAYNPYTEPSMEIHAKKPNGGWMEVGNSGVFRPEMLRPMGLPENCTAIAWGLGVERVAMRHCKLDSVQDLVGHRVNLKFVKRAPIPRV